MDHIIRAYNLKWSFQSLLTTILVFLLTLIVFVGTNHAQEAAYIDIGTGDIYVAASDPGVTFMNLRVMDPLGEIIFDKSSDGSPIQWVPYGVSLDGYYSYEVRVGYGEMNRVRNDPQEEGVRMRPWRKSGTVLVHGGAIVPPDEEEASLLKDIYDITKLAFSRFRDFLVTPAYADVLHYDDVIITGSECLGFDCADGESFGFDTLKIKENNLRIFFEDTSSTANFPTNDWRILINDTTSGGGSYFAIQDATNSRTPFKIEAGAPADSLYVDDYGRVGLGTSVPAVELHIADSDTPTVRLRQDGSGGYTPQTWDVAGNESNFFIRDVTNGSQLSFRIQPDAPTDTLTLKSDGNVGIGTWSPTSALHVQRTDDAQIHVQNTSATSAERVPFKLTNNGKTRFTMVNGSDVWTFDNDGSYFNISYVGTFLNEFRVDSSGHTYARGTSYASAFAYISSRTMKHDIEFLDEREVLSKLMELPVSTWKYNADKSGAQHIGPMAEDFHDVFGLSDGKHISTVDTDGVALAAIQGLYQVVKEDNELLRQDNEELKQSNEELNKRISALEELIFNSNTSPDL